MFTGKLIAIFGFMFAILTTNAVAADKLFTGVFEGGGRACTGRLFIRTKTIEWHTPFTVCKRTPYKILKKNVDITQTEIVFLLKRKTNIKCDFEVISLKWNPQQSRFWNVTGYESLSDYESGSDYALACGLDKL